MTMQIVAFGDSITNGSHVSIGWADQLRSHLFDRFHEKDPDGYPRMYNLGIPGETTEGLIRRFDAETAARVREKYGSIIVLISYGTNDVATAGTSSEHAVSIERYEENIRQVLEKARNLTDRIALLASPPVVEGKPNPNAKNRLNADIRTYNSVLVRLADEYGTQLLDLYGEFEKHDTAKLLNEDGIHPNAPGHAIIFDLVKEYVFQHCDG